ncbi:replication initiation protein [Paenibacillus sp. p3-SID867]|uniref:replication initiation protein n=1 Tax=Paenibacillus sp. p3-SID867 TaxID=2916363 RepID=UPI0021A44D45|nr:replication initiation protein [Paenibacillus sp. p3-SID867]MCT1403112.1 replication initiation protein [Paenibacillus sp. p3-SID867]
MSYKASYFGLQKITLTEIKILLWLSDVIRWNLTPFHSYEATLADLSQRMRRKSIKYSELKSSLNHLATQEITIHAGSVEFEKKLIENLELSRGSVIKFRMHASVEILFLRIAKLFNSDEIDLLLKAKSIFTIKLYSLVRDSIWADEVVSIENLRAMLGLHHQYPRYGNFKSRILAPAIEEIKELLGLSINIVEHKTVGNRVFGLQFHPSRFLTHVHLDINQEDFFDQARLFTGFLGVKLTPDLYSKWLRKGEYAFIIALDYVQTRIDGIRQPVPYLSKLIETGSYGQPLNGLRPEEYLLIRDFLEPFREITSFTPHFVIENEFKKFCSEKGFEQRADQIWLKSKEKIIYDINNYVTHNRKKKHPAD